MDKPWIAVVLLLGSIALAACEEGVPPELRTIEDRVVGVGEEMTLLVFATDADGDSLDYSFSADVPGIEGKAEFGLLPVGAAEFRWTPLAEDIGEWYFDFRVSDGHHAVETTARIDVRSSVGSRSAPRFIRPSGAGIGYRAESLACIDLDIVVGDDDSSSVIIHDESTGMVGAALKQTGPFTALWQWCPTEEDLASEERFQLLLSADDRDNPPTLFAYLIAIRTGLPDVTDLGVFVTDTRGESE